jgi:Ca2+-binding RTX toxin-like protein
VNGSTTPVSPLSLNAASSPVPGGGDPVYVLTPDSVQGASGIVYSLSTSPTGYIVDSIGGALTLSTGAGDSVLVAAINSATTVLANGGGNQVIFVTGDNTYTAGATDSGNDTIVAGSGQDTITTAVSGATTVNSGTGYATINLKDTGTGGFNDHVWLDDGHATVNADGTGDAVIATIAGQTVNGGTSASGVLGVALLPNSDGSANGNDVINAGAGTTTVYDYSSNNSVVAGSGVLYFVAGANVSATVDGGAGNVFGFAGSGDSINIGGSGNGVVYFAAGTGNETLDGASSSNTQFLFGGTAAAGQSQELIGGNGKDVLTAGSGTETLTGGTGANTYQLVDGTTTNGSITISDFTTGSNQHLVLDGFSANDVQTLLTGGTESGGNYTVDLSNGLKITFDNATASSLTGHIVTFGSN